MENILQWCSRNWLIASRILHEICLLIGELAIRGTKLILNARLGTKSNLLIEQLLLGEHFCIRLSIHNRTYNGKEREKSAKISVS